MRAAVFQGPGKLALEDVPTPDAGPGEVLLKVGANTVCGTDVRILRGEKSKGIDIGIVLGHEIAGEVVAVGPGAEGYAEGDRVALMPSVTCGRCWYCTHHLEQFCDKVELFGYRVDGGLAEYCLLPREAVARGNAIKARGNLPFEHLALMEPLSCVLNGRENYGSGVGDTVVVLGAGPIGLLHARLAHLAGALNVVVSDPSASRRAAAQRLGASVALDPTADDLNAAVADLTDGRGADVAVICIGRGQLFLDALGLVRKGGRVNAFAGFPAGGSVAVDPNTIHYGEIHVTGTSNSRRDHGEAALRLLESGAIGCEEIVTHRYALEDAIEGIEFSAGGDGVKVAIVP